LTLQRTLFLILLALATVAIGLLLYLTVADKAVVVEIAPREELRPPQPSDSDRLIIPVAGVRPEELVDSYGAPRSGGRAHLGIDILAPEGTPVLAAATGVIVARDSSALGGLGIYQRDLDERTIYFYGHLQRYQPELEAGDLVRQGTVIAYVGQTGNVPPGSPHLHFSVHIVTDPNSWWRGRDVSPCDLLPCGAPEKASGP
jgi:murein DD-endopeptidase MepM/ murein hydrolase activator NlpD